MDVTHAVVVPCAVHADACRGLRGKTQSKAAPTNVQGVLKLLEYLVSLQARTALAQATDDAAAAGADGAPYEVHPLASQLRPPADQVLRLYIPHPRCPRLWV